MEKLRKRSFQSLVFACLLLGAGGSEVWAGGHAGGGGDIRRFRSQFALLQSREAFEALYRYRTCYGIPNIDDFLDQLAPVSSALQLSRIHWSTDPSDRCLRITQGADKKIDLRFSYQKCPIPTPKHYYLKAIFEGVSRGRFGVETMLKAISCKGGIKPGRPGLSFQPADFKDPVKAVRILQAGRQMAYKAVQKLQNLRDDSLPEPIEEFLIRNYKALLHEVANAPHSVESSSESCGFTKLQRGATIYFSRSKCLDFQSDLDVAWVILHESVHHLGVEAEEYADAVATWILNANFQYDTY